MNVYVVVEGRVVEKAVYKQWIPEANTTLRPATYITDVTQNNFYIVSGDGYPGYFETILDALEDVSTGNVFDRLVVCIDSEEMTLQEKYDEVDDFIQASPYKSVKYRIVVQHFCFEAWALGNRRIGSKNPQDPTLVRYRRLYSVLKQDPEGLPPLPDENLNRSQFAEKYLRATLNDKRKNLTYSKRNPKVVAHRKYYWELHDRLIQTGHIASFRAFVDAFI